MAKVKGLSESTARKVLGLIRAADDGSPAGPTPGTPGGPPWAVVRCGAAAGDTPRPHWDGYLRAAGSLGGYADAGSVPVYLASLSAADLVPGRDYPAVRGGSHRGRPVYWADPADCCGPTGSGSGSGSGAVATFLSKVCAEYSYGGLIQPLTGPPADDHGDTPGDGYDGDYALDSAHRRFYGPKAGGTWGPAWAVLPPVPPASGTFTLRSVDGVLSWA